MIYIVSPWLWWQVLGATLAILRLANRDTRLNIAVPLVVGLTPKYLVFSRIETEQTRRLRSRRWPSNFSIEAAGDQPQAASKAAAME